MKCIFAYLVFIKLFVLPTVVNLPKIIFCIPPYGSVSHPMSNFLWHHLGQVKRKFAIKTITY